MEDYLVINEVKYYNEKYINNLKIIINVLSSEKQMLKETIKEQKEYIDEEICDKGKLFNEFKKLSKENRKLKEKLGSSHASIQLAIDVLNMHNEEDNSDDECDRECCGCLNES